jgi:hypothetical protein
MHPLVKWSLILFAIIVLTAPTLGAQILGAGVDAVQGAIAALQVFGSAVVPK